MQVPRLVAPNTLIQNRYLVVRMIGQGGMGAVYEAIDQRLGNTVALKQTLVVGAQFARAFEREARILAGLRYPALPKVMDFFSDPAGQFLVMEFIAGDDLARLLAQRGAPFPPDVVLRWGDQVLDTLDYLHTHQPPIVHRDIKPHNLKLTPRGEVILLDFGLAKGASTLQTGALNTSSTIGFTPLYGPLEQIQGAGTDSRSDLYALAATLYHLLTGAPPVDALTRAATTLRHQPDPLRPAHILNPHVPVAVSTLLTQAMALNPDARPHSAAAMRAALQAAGQALPQTVVVRSGGATTQVANPGGPAPTIATAPASYYRGRSPRVRFWVWSAVGALLALVVLAVLGLSGILDRGSNDPGTLPTAALAIADQPTSDPGAAPPPTRTPRPSATPTPQPPDTPTPRPSATPTPHPPAILTDIERSAQFVYAAVDGRLVHDDDDFVECTAAGVSLRDFIVEGRFYNPYDRSKGSWDYGLMFRDTGKSQQYRLAVTSAMAWDLELVDLVNGEAQFTTVAEGSLNGLDTSSGGSNSLRLIVNDTKAFFYVNDRYIDALDVSGKTVNGDISTCTGMFADDEISGETTRIENFTVWSIGEDASLLTQARQQGRLVAADDFADNNNKWFLGDSSDGRANRAIRDGRMIMTLREANILWLETWKDQQQDFAAEVDITPGTPGAGGGIIFGHQDSANYFYARITSGSYTLEKRQNDQWTTITPWTQHPAIHDDLATNKVMVLRKGGTIRIYVNSTLVGQAQDESFLAGKVGIAAGSGSAGGAEVYLDNFRLWKLP